MEEFKLNFYIIYAFFAAVAVIFAMYVDIKKKHYNVYSVFFAGLLFLIIALLFGLRSTDVGTDTGMVSYQFDYQDRIDFGFQFMYDFLMLVVGWFTDDYHFFLLTLSVLYNGLIFTSVLLLSKKIDFNIFLVGFSFVSFYFFESLGINIVRQGVSLALFLLAVSLYFRKPQDFKIWLIPFVLAIGFHITTAVVFFIFVFVILLKKIKIIYYYLLYFVILIVSILGGSILSFGSLLSYFFLVDNQKAEYYINNENGENYAIGFKPQFAAFNTIFLIFFSFINAKIFKYENREYQILLKYYMVMSTVFFMMFQIPFSDRWGVMSWVVIPFLLAPLFTINKTAKYSIGTLSFLILIFVFFSMYYSDLS